MLYYIYDGTFDGFLTAVRVATERRELPERIITEDRLERDLFSEIRIIRTDFEKAREFLSRISRRLSREDLKTVLYCYLSTEPEREATLCEYLQKVMVSTKNIADRLIDPVVLKVWKNGEKVAKEVHRFKGIVRFREIEPGFFYAPIEPDHHITPLLAAHFKNRFADQQWFIHDRRRNTGIFFDGTRVHFLKEIELKPELERLSSKEATCFAKAETDSQNLWNMYFKSIKIQERSNPRLQRQYLPSRYWKYLVEDSSENSSTLEVFP